MRGREWRVLAGILVAGALMVGAYTGLAVSKGKTASPSGGTVETAPPHTVPPSVAQAEVQGPSGHGPFIDGKEVTLDEAESDAGFKLHRPDDSLASDELISTIGFGTQPQTQVAIDYSSGVEVRLDQWMLNDTPDNAFQRFADQLSGQTGESSSNF